MGFIAQYRAFAADQFNQWHFTIAALCCSLLLFAVVVCLPTWRTGRMSYVDVGWPWGLALIGALTWLLSQGDNTRVVLVSIAYIFAGSRMGFGALIMWHLGKLNKELPRYEYQKRR
ncbi:MAG: steroid 5-alpha reductase family enzyme [Alteromonadaceae bacterium]